MPPEFCPNCGAEVPRTAKACPECGSDEKTGWAEEAAYSGLDLPEENFDYQDYIRKEFGQRTPVPSGTHWFWWVVGLGLVASLIMLWAR